MPQYSGFATSFKIPNAGESEMLARQVPDDLSVYLIPAFTGLGAPYWDPEARGALLGMTRDTGIPEIVAAGLMSVVYQTRTLLMPFLPMALNYLNSELMEDYLPTTSY